ncbi:tail fiber domain-containing protein [Psychroserpens sp. BH13MA-6]
MKQKFILASIGILLSFSLNAQVGIGNTNPQAQLDISASNVTTPSNTDGILIPRMDVFPAANPTAAQDGMLIFITGNSTPNKGFYYWDNASTSWVNIKGIEKIDDLLDGKSDSDGTQDGSSIFLGVNAGANDDSTDNKNIGIGYNALALNSISENNTIIGYNSASSMTGPNNVFIGTEAGWYPIGHYSTGNILIGYRAGYNIGNLQNKLYIENSSNISPLVYGEFDNDILRINGEFQIGSPTTTGYAFPLTDGASGQVMTTDGAGNVSFQDAASNNDADWYQAGTTNVPINNSDDIFTEGNVGIGVNNPDVSLDISGQGEIINTSGDYTLIVQNDSDYEDGSAILAESLSTYNLRTHSAISSSNALTNFSVDVNKFNNVSGLKTGVHILSNNINSNDIGFLAELNNFNTGFATFHQVIGSLSDITYNVSNANVYGFRALISGSGTSAKYGLSSYISPTSGGVHYGVRSEALGTNSYSGYFLGDVYVGTDSSNGYIFPSTDGSANQVLQTDGNGALSWSTLSSPTITGTTNYIPKFTGTTALGNSQIYDSGTNVGIGTTTPSEKLSVNGLANLNEGIASGIALKVNGSEALWYNGSIFSWGFGGASNLFVDKVGIGAGTGTSAYKLEVRDTQASDYIAYVNNQSTNASADGLRIELAYATPGVNNYFIGFYGNGSLRGRISGNTTSTGTNFYTTSDGRLKENIVDISNALTIIKTIKPREYNYLSKKQVKEYGFIAQELQNVYPQAVSGSPDSDLETDPMMVDYSKLTPLLTAGLKELNKKVEQLEEENKTLKSQLEKYKELEARLSAVEANAKTNN